MQMTILASHVNIDRKIFKELLLHIEQLRARYGLRLQYEVLAGSDTQQALSAFMRGSHIVLPLLSADFLNDELFTAAIQEAVSLYADSGKPIVLPILIRQCSWQEWGVLKDVRIANSKAIKSRKDKDEAYQEVMLVLQFFLDILLLDEELRKKSTLIEQQSAYISELENRLQTNHN